MLNDELLERYSRQILVPEIDLVGQENIRRASVHRHCALRERMRRI